jgi:hypothetical protein
MALYRVTFAEHGGWTVTTRIRAPAEASHVMLAARKVWGSAAYWRGVHVGTNVYEGRVYEATGTEEEPIPRLGLATVTVERVRRKVRP